MQPGARRPWAPGGPPAPNGWRAETPPSVPDDVMDQYRHLREDIIKMEAAANEAEERGDTEGAKFKLMLAGDMNEKIRELEEKHPGLTAPPPKEQQAIVEAPPAQAPPPFRPFMGVPPPLALLQMTNMGYPPAQEPMTVTQQQALLYDLAKANSMKMEPDVIEFSSHFELADRHARALNDQLKVRNNTYDEDLAALYDILGKCNNSAQRADLLNMNVRWMKEGVFSGQYGPNPEVVKAAKKYKLDPPSACKLCEALEGRKDPDDDLMKICMHLERSNRPSSLVMMMLKDLKAGNAIDSQSVQTPAIGSYLHRKETLRAEERKRSNSRNRSRGRRGSRRSASRSRGRRRSRSARRARSGSRRRRD
mmetsp:Transcript_48214/g.127680  ORF Transcript_48214/g.127680 Transcript_48214/m.127680 type:complete len:364 (-) Transcript_48214:177-1268(-)